ncbi:unnamed protein product [Caenorhabditis sp. 36 PRJEB53466]|nr:unnamed protein product [Caenorhabditis sp. 36 PRJEB53466]
MHNGQPGRPGYQNWRRNQHQNSHAHAPHGHQQNAIYVEPVYAPPPHFAPNFQQVLHRRPNEVDPGMNGDGWQGPGGGRGGAHHMNGGGGGRRGGGGGGGGGGGMHNQRMPPNQHHGGMNRMMPPSFRQPQQSQFMTPYAMGAMPGDMMDLNMRMGDISLSSTPNSVQYADMGPPPPVQQGWNQPAPFAPQDDLYDPNYGIGGMPPQPPHPFGGVGPRGGGNQGGYGNNGSRMQSRQGGYSRGVGGGGGGQNNFNMGPPMMGPPMVGQSGGQPFYGNQQQPPFAPSPFSMSSAMSGGTQHEHHGSQGQNGFQISASSMDDYSMWTDKNDEDAKRKKILRDKGLLAWGDSEVSNNKPIRRWLVPEGQEEDFESAMARCPSHLKKKSLNEEALRRRLGSDNPQIVAQAQQQAEEEANATMKVGRRPIIPCGWGDLPLELSGEKSDYDQGSSKGWDEQSVNGMKSHHMHHPDEALMPWNLPGVVGGPSSNETRNPFFAQHMQQQQQQQHHLPPHLGGYGGDNGDSVWPTMMDGSSMAPPAGNGGGGGGSSVPLGMLSMASAAVAVMGGHGNDEEGSQKKLADSLKLAVEKGHLDISLLSLPHIPPNVLDLLTEILSVIPRLDGYEDELKKLVDSRPSTFDEKDDPETWMNKEQKNEHDKTVIGVVTSKIEVTQLSKKITEALVEAGLIAQSPQTPDSGASSHHHHHHQHHHHHIRHQGPPPPGPDGGASPSTSSRGGNGGPPDHYYDYSFLG